MKHLWLIVVGCLIFFAGCAGSGGVRSAGESVGAVLRAPVDLVTGIGRGLSGRRYTPGRAFQQNWQTEEQDPVFWESDAEFFSSL